MATSIDPGALSPDALEIARSGPIELPEPLTVGRGGLWRAVGPAVSLLILLAAIVELRSINAHALVAMLPATPVFWLAFVCYYLAGPASEWIIFRRLWGLPAAGFAPLVRKLVANELLMGYLGEAYFYAWARAHSRLVASPFAAIKDVTVLSALAGNAFTLVAVIATAPLLRTVDVGIHRSTMIVSAAVLVLPSLAAFAFRRRLFSLPARELCVVTAIHAARIVATGVLAAVMWHLMLPAVALSWWVLLVTLRQLLSRLPLIPNKDVVFAGLATVIVGRHIAIVDAVALMAGLILAAHVLVGMALALHQFIQGPTR